MDIRSTFRVLLLAICFCLFSCSEDQVTLSTNFSSDWHQFPDLDRHFAGKTYWLNPLQSWKQKDGKLQVTTSGGDRNCVLLTRELSPAEGDLQMEVRLEAIASEENANPSDTNSDQTATDGQTKGQITDYGWVGFQVGLKGAFNDFRDDAIHGRGFCAGITTNGQLFIGSPDSNALTVSGSLAKGTLKLLLQPDSTHYQAKLIFQSEEGKEQSMEANIHASWLNGLMALTCSQVLPEPLNLQVPRPAFSEIPELGKKSGGQTLFAFSNWKLSGKKLVQKEEQAYGPILWVQHTLSDQVLKMSAQFVPIGNDNRNVDLLIDGQEAVSGEIAEDGNNVLFRIPAWDDSQDHSYTVRYVSKEGTSHFFEGVIPRNVPESTLKVASLSCVDDVGFPHQDLVDHVLDHEVDLYVFHGDQLYERVAGYGVERNSKLDYLRKWYIFGWSFREMMRNKPTVIIPDDHDVFHGNLWGEGGKLADVSLGYGYDSQDSGGYKEKPDFVNMVHRTQTGHLPDPFDDAPVKNGISVYYTNMNYKGVSFAILGDRQWKSAPKPLLPEAEIENGWPQNKQWNAKTQAFHPDAQLLGSRQEEFLESWVENWGDKVYMKALISQSPFCNVATLPKDIYHDKYVPGLPRYREGDYPPDDRPVADFDSNGWPQNKRDKAIKIIRKAFALHFTGDQHLGSTGIYGVDKYNDAGHWISCPAVANLWPRRWFPEAYGADGALENSPRYTGKYEDGFGNKITVKAIANPYDRDRHPDRIFDKAPGYSIIEFDLESRTLELAVWPRWASPKDSVDNQPYPGWPIQLDQLENYGRVKAGTLPGIEVNGQEVVKVYDEDSNKLVYALCPKAGMFAPFIFDESRNYRLEKWLNGQLLSKKEGTKSD